MVIRDDVIIRFPPCHSEERSDEESGGGVSAFGFPIELGMT
jgi:hypothetical protein